MIKLQYIASSGNTYELNKDGILINEVNFHSWAWKADGVALQYGQRLVQFSRDSVTYSANLVLRGPYTKRKAILERLHEDMERDIRMKTPGRLVWEDWYISCYATESTTEPGLGETDNQVGFFCPRPFWVRERVLSFEKAAEAEEGAYLDYPTDYAYDYYKGNSGTRTVVRTFPFASEFKMDIFGPSASSSVYINGHEHGLDYTITEGAYATINSRDNTIVLTQINGEHINLFDYRVKASDIFAQIPGGTLTVQWSGEFGFDLTIYEERSEPTWS